MEGTLSAEGQEPLGKLGRPECSSVRGSEGFPPSSTASSSSAPDPVAQHLESNFIQHKVTKLDTLAGLAVKYAVPVSEIKRFNGLLSDSAMYARDTLLIPTKLLPVGEEVQMIFAQIASGIGRDPILNRQAHLQPASAAVARVARSLNIVNGDSYPTEMPGDAPWWCQCGACDEEDGNYTCRACSRRLSGSSIEPGEVEMMERTGENLNMPKGGAGPTRMHDLAHRRRRAAPDELDEGREEHSLHLPWQSQAAQQQHALHRQHQPASGSGHSAATSRKGGGQHGSFLSGLGKAIDSSFQKLKQAATQPALANGSSRSLTDAADGVMGSLRVGLLPKSGVSLREWNGGSPGAAELPCSFPASSSHATPVKHSKRD